MAQARVAETEFTIRSPRKQLYREQSLLASLVERPENRVVAEVGRDLAARPERVIERAGAAGGFVAAVAAAARGEADEGETYQEQGARREHEVGRDR